MGTGLDVIAEPSEKSNWPLNLKEDRSEDSMRGHTEELVLDEKRLDLVEHGMRDATE